MKILSIDIDYAFSPDIAEYDDHVQGSTLDPADEWKHLKKKGFSKPRVNKQKLQQILLVYEKALTTASEVYFIQDHHEIVSHLPIGEVYDIVNFDHHHDVFYPGWHSKKILDEGNWVNWIDELGFLGSYTWYRNKDSEDLDPSVKLKCSYEEKFYDHDPLPEFDYVFVCSSPNWVHEDNIYVLKAFKEGKADGKICL